MGSVFWFQLLDNGEFRMGLEAVTWVLKMLANINSIRLLGIVSVFIHSDIHWPFTFANILNLANDTFHEVDNPLTFAVEFVKDVVCLFRPVALEFFGLTDLFATFVFSSG